MKIDITPERVTGTSHAYECPKGGCDWSYVIAIPQGQTSVVVHSMMTAAEIETAVADAVATRDKDFRDKVEARVLGHILESHLTAHLSDVTQEVTVLRRVTEDAARTMSDLADSLKEADSYWYDRSEVSKRNTVLITADSLAALAAELRS